MCINDTLSCLQDSAKRRKLSVLVSEPAFSPLLPHMIPQLRITPGNTANSGENARN